MPASSISGTSFSMVNGSGICGFMPGTHGQSGDSAFHRCTCASTIRRLACAAAGRGAACCAIASATPAPTVLLRKLRRDSISDPPCFVVAMTFKPLGRDYVPVAGAEWARIASGPARSFDHLVGEQHERVRHHKSDRLGGLEINNQFVTGR